MAGLPSVNGGGAAASVPPTTLWLYNVSHWTHVADSLDDHPWLEWDWHHLSDSVHTFDMLQRRVYSGVHTAHDVERQRWMPWRTIYVRRHNDTGRCPTTFTCKLPCRAGVARCRAVCQQRR